MQVAYFGSKLDVLISAIHSLKIEFTWNTGISIEVGWANAAVALNGEKKLINSLVACRKTEKQQEGILKTEWIMALISFAGFGFVLLFFWHLKNNNDESWNREKLQDNKLLDVFALVSSCADRYNDKVMQTSKMERVRVWPSTVKMI